MLATHLITAPPRHFAREVNSLIESRDTALHLSSITKADGLLTAVLVELPHARSVAGALRELRLEETSDPALVVAELAAENPFWSVAIAWAIAPAPEAKKKRSAGVLLAAILVQP